MGRLSRPRRSRRKMGSRESWEFRMTDGDNKPKTLTLKDFRKSQKPLLYRSKRYGSVRIRPFVSLNDLAELSKFTKDTQITSREFTEKVLMLVVEESGDKNFSAWDDKTLIAVARKWVRAAMPKDIGDGEIRTFDDFQSIVLAHVNKSWAEIQKSTSVVLKNIENTTKPMMAALSRQLDVMANIQPTIEIMRHQLSLITNMRPMMTTITEAIQTISKLSDFASSLIPKLPDFSNFFISVRRSVEEANEIREILSLSEYELAPLLLDTSELKGLKGKPIKQIVTRKLVAVTLSDDFSDEIERLFNIPALRKRRLAIKQAMVAHRTRQYFLSVPVFLSQAEGVFTELLVIRDLAERVKGGVVGKKDRNKLISLQKKVNLAKGRFEPGLEKTAVDVVLDRMVNKRNEILHGGNASRYGTSRMSTETLLLLYALSSFLESDLDSQEDTLN